MEPENTNSTAITFTTDNIESSKARDDQQYFVHIIKNPILRLLLRVHIIKEPEPEKQPTPAPKPAPQAPEKRPQCRVTIRVSSLAINKKKKHNGAKIAIILLSIALAGAVLAAAYFAIS